MLAVIHRLEFLENVMQCSVSNRARLNLAQNSSRTRMHISELGRSHHSRIKVGEQHFCWRELE